MSALSPKGPIAWMANNRVAANLLLSVFIIGGLIMGSRIQQEVFPEFELDIVQVSVIYQGASPEEVEEGIILSIEDEVRSLDGVKKVDSTAFEGRGIVNVEILSGASAEKVAQDVKNAVDKIQSFPLEAERPIVSLLTRRRQVVSLLVHGRSDKKVLRDLAEKIRDELTQIEGITLVELESVPPPEIEIEISSDTLRAYNLKLGQVASIVKATALDLPGGGVKTATGEILLRTKEKRDLPSEFATIPIVANADGSRVLLQDIASIKEGFEDTDEEAYFNGEPAVRIEVFRVGEQNPLDIAAKVKAYAEALDFPTGIQVDVWNDRSEVYRDRINLLLKNAVWGLLLIFILLGLFLEPSLAFWVTVGIPVSIIGAFLIIPWTGATINMISLFAFLITLGIVVDDAILVGENVYHNREKGMPYLQAAVEGARQIAGPVCFAVLTNVAAFLPLFFVPGTTGKFFLQIPSVVVAVLLISLIESLFVLPAHLTIEHRLKGVWRWLNKPNQIFEAWLKRFINYVVGPQVKAAMEWRYLTAACSICLLVMSGGLLIGGHIKFSYLPRVDSDLVTAQVVLPYGIPIESARTVQQLLKDSAVAVLDNTEGSKISRGIYSQIGKPMPGGGPGGGDSGTLGSHIVGVQLFLVPSDQREISGIEFAKQWREQTGEISGAETSAFIGMTQTSGAPIEIHLSHTQQERLESASKELAETLKNYKGVSDIDDGAARGKPQLSFTLKPEARSLQVTSRDLAEQVRNAFYGAEALRQQRGRDELKVMVRLPERERKNLASIEELVIRTPQGGEIPISEAVNVAYDTAYTRIKRTDGRRIQVVSADVDEEVANANQILDNIRQTILPGLIEKYPGLSFTFEGNRREQLETLDALKGGMGFALFIIYALLAIPFKSYLQPMVVMLSIPFGVIGAFIGHLLLGYEISIISMFGIVALAGVVINDSLVLVVTINNNLAEGMSMLDAVVDAGKRRFRPILLTSLTTFFGLAPMIFETSVQARFLVPMAISLGFGVLFSTAIVLLITSSFYLILDDLNNLWFKSRSHP